MHTAARLAVNQAGAAIDPSDHARVLASLALAHFRIGDLENARTCAEESIAVCDRAGVTDVMLGPFVLGSVHSAQGRFAAVAEAFERGLAIGRALGPAAHGSALVSLGELHLKLERYVEAAAYYRQAADIAASVQTPMLTAEADRGLAAGLINLGRFDEAITTAERSAAVNREYGPVLSLVFALDTLALAHLGAGRPEQAIDHLAEAIDVCRTLTHTHPAALILNTLGETYRYGGDHALALASHEEALDLATRAPDRYERTRALVGLGDAHAALGSLGRAQALWREALNEYTDMGLPTAARLQARLRDAG
jgi:tetratricopeptide (TPR) repeat protein